MLGYIGNINDKNTMASVNVQITIKSYTQNMKCGYEDDVKDPIYFKFMAIEKNEMVQVVQDRRREKTQSMMGT